MTYLRLFRGQPDPDDPSDGWNLDGPIFGPFRYVTVIYADEIRLTGAGRSVLKFHDEFVYYDSVFFGDWCIFDGPPSGGEELLIEEFNTAHADIAYCEPPLDAAC